MRGGGGPGCWAAHGLLALFFLSIVLGALPLPQLEASPQLMLLLACVHPLHLSGYAIVSCEPTAWRIGHYLPYCHHFFLLCLLIWSVAILKVKGEMVEERLTLRVNWNMFFFNLSLWLGQISICIRLNQWIRRLMHSNLVKLELRVEKCLYQVVRGIKACRSLPAVQISSSEFSVLAYKIVHLVFFLSPTCPSGSAGKK